MSITALRLEGEAFPAATAEIASDEDELLQRARLGDLAALNALVVANERAIFGLCRRFLADDGAAEDATQEAFIAFWRNLQNLRSPLQPWLFTVARNLCRSQLRRPVLKRSFSLDRALENGMSEPLEQGPLPEAATLNEALRHSIEDALLQLPSDQRLALTLREIDGFSYQEIAVATLASMGTVKSRIARARLRIRGLLAPLNLMDTGSCPRRIRAHDGASLAGTVGVNGRIT